MHIGQSLPRTVYKADAERKRRQATGVRNGPNLRREADPKKSP